MGTFRTTIEIDRNGMDCEREIVVEYDAIPFERGATDGRYGPKIEPDIPAHIEITQVLCEETGQELELTSTQEEWIEEQIAEYLDERDECDD